MHRKALQVQVELDIQAVTCPGVFLCPNGKVSLQLYMLDSCIQTISCPPIFPILCHEKFIFYKMFYQAQRLSDLQKLLSKRQSRSSNASKHIHLPDKESLYMELIQWQSSEIGNVLATFQTTLSELLYPSTIETSVAGVDIDLLMEPERSFPGVIAPKVEVSTKTIIEDTVLDSNKSTSYVVNPKVIQSRNSNTRSNILRQKKVCHSSGYHRSRKCCSKTRKQTKPPFIIRKVDERLIGRKPVGLTPCYHLKCRRCSPSKRSEQEKDFDKNSNYLDRPPKIKTDGLSKTKTRKNCLCGGGHDDYCPVCSKYKYYFESDTSPRNQSMYPMSTANRKSCVLQNHSKPGKHCTCQELSSTKNARVIRCTSAKETNGKSCPCTLKISNLAAKLHDRLNQALEYCDCECYDEFTGRNSASSEGDTEESCECPNLRVGDFYKNFYRKARSKIQCDKYIAPCCI